MLVGNTNERNRMSTLGNPKKFALTVLVTLLLLSIATIGRQTTYLATFLAKSFPSSTSSHSTSWTSSSKDQHYHSSSATSLLKDNATRTPPFESDVDNHYSKNIIMSSKENLSESTTNSMLPDFSTSTTDIDSAIAALQDIRIRYYVYENEMLSFKHSLWNSTSLSGDAKREIEILQALENHPLRTVDPEQADFFIVPIPLLALHTEAQMHQALSALLSTEMFQNRHGANHILFALESRYFDAYGKGPLQRFWNTQLVTTTFHQYLQNVMVVRNHDMMACRQMHKDRKNDNENTDHGDWNRLFQSVKPLVRYSFSIGIAAGLDVPYVPIATTATTTSLLEAFDESRPIGIFYRTRKEPSANGSTKYRHAPLNLNLTTISSEWPSLSSFPQHHSIGLDLDRETWLHDLTHSKFCLVIRGDTPHSHALMRAVQVGCIPVIVSDYYPVYAPTFRSTLDMKDFSIFIAEDDFLKDPLGQLQGLFLPWRNDNNNNNNNNADDDDNNNNNNNKNTALSREILSNKLRALRFAQQVTSLAHPESLFIPAFLKEAMLTVNPNATFPSRES